MSVAELIGGTKAPAYMKTRVINALESSGFDTLESVLDGVATFEHVHSTAAKLDHFLREIPRVGRGSRKLIAGALAPVLARDPRFQRLTGTPAIVRRLRVAVVEAITALDTLDPHGAHARDLRARLDEIDEEINQHQRRTKP